MSRYKSINTNPQFLVIDLAQHRLPGDVPYAPHDRTQPTLDFRSDFSGASDAEVEVL
jgi:hypothetical protein